jgi:hypothetical protein
LNAGCLKRWKIQKQITIDFLPNFFLPKFRIPKVPTHGNDQILGLPTVAIPRVVPFHPQLLQQQGPLRVDDVSTGPNVLRHNFKKHNRMKNI